MLAKWWPDIEDEYKMAIRSSGIPQSATHRPEREVLDELVLRVRALEGQNQLAASAPKSTRRCDEQTSNLRFLSMVYALEIPRPTHFQKSFALFLRDIDHRKYSTIEELDKVIERARPAVERYASENPDWFQFGTDYITKSLGFVDPSFRRRHGFAARTREAFEAYGDLVL